MIVFEMIVGKYQIQAHLKQLLNNYQNKKIIKINLIKCIIWEHHFIVLMLFEIQIMIIL